MGNLTIDKIIQNLFSHHPDGLLVICSGKNTIQYMNAAAHKMLGVPVDIYQHIQFDYPVPSHIGEEVEFTCQSTGRILSVVYLADIAWQENNCCVLSLNEVIHIRQNQALPDGQENPFLEILTHSQHAVALTDEHGSIIEWNSSAESLFGLSRQDVLGEPLWKVQFRFEPLERRSPENLEYLKLFFSDMLTHGHSPHSDGRFDLEVDYQWLTTNKRQVESIVFPVKLGQNFCLASITRDVSRLKRLEESLRASEIRYRTLFNVSPVALWEKDLSKVKEYIDKLQADGVEDIDDYFLRHPDDLLHCIDMVRYIEINTTALELFEAKNIEQMVGLLKTFHTESQLEYLRKEFTALAQGLQFIENEVIQKTMSGTPMYTLVKISLAPGCEDTWSKVFVSITDITEYRHLETAARYNEERYRNLFEKSPIALYEEDMSQVKQHLDRLYAGGIHDFERYFNENPEELVNCFCMIKYRDMNLEAVHLFEASQKKELAQKNHLFLYDSYRRRFQNELVTLINGSLRFEGEASHATLSGKTVYTMMSVIIPPGYENTWSTVIVSFMDLTERRNVEEALRLSEERYRAVVESQTEIILKYDAEGFVTFVNNAFCRFRNIEAGEIIGSKFQLFVHPEDQKKVDEALENLSPQNPVVVVENRNIDSEGKIHWFRWTNHRIFDENGQFVEHQSVGHEITDRVQAENALRLSEERYRAVIEGQTDLIYRFLPDNTISFANEAFARFVGLSEEELVGKNRHSLTYTEDREKVDEMMSLLSPDNPISIYENRNINLAGEIRWFRWVNRRFFNEDGKYIEHQSVGHDITERVHAEEKLRRYANRLNVLHNIDQAILNLQEPENVFRVVLGYMADLGFNEYSSIVFFDRETNSAERIAVNRNGTIRLEDPDERIRYNLPVLPSELADGRMRIVEEVNFEEEERLGFRDLFSGGLASYLAIPLFMRGRLAGVFTLAFSTARQYDRETLEVVRQVADSLAVAVQNARLHQADQLARQRAQNLRQATSAISSDLDLEQALDNILVHLEQVVPYKRASIFLKKGDFVRLVAGRGFDNLNAPVGFQAPIKDSLTNKIMGAQKAVVLEDASKDSNFFGWADTAKTRGWMGVPLIWRQNVIGYLAMDSLLAGAYGEEEGALAQDYANQAAIAIENARLYEDARRRAREAETLARTATAVTATLDRELLISRILEQLEQVVPYDSASVLLLDGNHLEIVGGRGFGDAMEGLLGLRIPLDEKNPDILVFRTRKPHILDDAPAEYEIFRSQPHNHTRSWLGVPLVFQNRFVGTLALDSLKPAFFNEDHARLATGFANQVATAMENVRLYEEARQQTNNLKRRDSILQAVSHAAEIFLRTARWREAMRNELKNLGLATDANLAFIHENFIGEDGRQMVRQCYQWSNMKTFTWSEEELYEGFCYEEAGLSRWRSIFQNNQHICSPTNDLPEQEKEIMRSNNIRYLMILPIFVQGEWWGTIGFIETMGEREWTSAEVDAIRAASDILAAAIQRERTEDALLASQKLADLGTLAAGVAHELNSPLQVITGSSEGLLRQIEKQESIDERRLKHSLEMINRSGWRSAEIVRSLLAYTRSSGGEQEIVNLNELIKDTLLLIEHQLRSWSNISVKTELAENLPPCTCNRNQITQVLINLMTNARDAMPDGGSINIQTDYLPDNRYIVIKVSDTGIGIPESIRTKIFSPFFTTKPLGQGTGLGLSIVMGIVESHGGQISVDSTHVTGTTFSIRLPVESNLPESQQMINDDLQGRYENIL